MTLSVWVLESWESRSGVTGGYKEAAPSNALLPQVETLDRNSPDEGRPFSLSFIDLFTGVVGMHS